MVTSTPLLVQRKIGQMPSFIFLELMMKSFNENDQYVIVDLWH